MASFSLDHREHQASVSSRDAVHGAEMHMFVREKEVEAHKVSCQLRNIHAHAQCVYPGLATGACGFMIPVAITQKQSLGSGGAS